MITQDSQPQLGRERRFGQVVLSVMSDRPSGGQLTLADKLNHLLETIRRPDGVKFSDADVATWITEHWDEFAEADADQKRRGVSSTYINYLRRGLRRQVSASIVVGLARFFGVDPRYLLPGNEKDELVHQQLLLLQDIQKLGLRGIKMRSDSDTESAVRLRIIRTLLAQVASEVETLANNYSEDEPAAQESD